MMRKKIRKILYSIFFLAVMAVSGQHNSNQNIDAANILPPSPSSSFKTEFGNLPINEFKGMPTVNIPVYNFSYGNIQHNISLNYSKLGVKVIESPDVAGMSWLLNVGGVINRTVFEYPDEKNERFLVSDPLSLNIQNLQEGSPEALQIIDKIKNVNIDNETDIFSFSVDEYSGSFYLDQNLQPVMLEDGSGIKIQSVGNFSVTYEFLMTAPNGRKYYFGGDGFTEETYNRNSMMTNAVTGFYLSKIEDGNKILHFSYYTDVHRAENFGLFQSKSLTYQNNFNSQVETNCSPPAPFSSSQGINTLNVRYPKRLKEISFENNKILFNYLAIPTQTYGKVDNIQVLLDNILKKQIDFSYISNHHRFFLEKVTYFEVKDAQKNFTSEIALEYNDPTGLPDKSNKGIDVLGYYNGRINVTYIPNLALLGSSSFNEPGDADRRAYFEYAQKGTLKSISYPTKGKTNFEYESIPAKKDKYEIINSIIGNNDFVAMMDLPVTYEKIQDYQFNPLIGDKILINLHLASNASPQVNKADALFEIVDKSNNQIVYSKSMLLGKTVSNFDWEAELNVDSAKIYQIKFKIQNYCNECNGSATIKYQSGFEKTDGLGIRLKKQYDTTTEGSIVNIKRLYYSKISDINDLNLISRNPYNPGLFTSAYYKQFLPQSNISTPEGGMGCAFLNYYIRQTIVHSNPQKSLEFGPFGYDNGFSTGRTVSVSHGGDNFELGGEEKEFIYNYENAVFAVHQPTYNPTAFADDTPDILSILAATFWNKMERNISFKNYNGLLTKNLILKNKGNNLFVSQKIENFYERDQTASVSNLIGMPIYDITFMPTGSVAGGELFNLLIGYYNTATYFNRLVKNTSTTYFQDLPYGTLDDSGYKKIKEDNFNQYLSPVKLLTKSILKSVDNSLTETNYSYAHEKGNQYLISKNMIGIPLETTVIKKPDSFATGKQISKSEILYPVSQTEADQKTSGLALPYEMQSAFANAPLATDVTYDKYDEKGNLLQYTSKDGISTAIVWGYNKTQPIAKILGASYSNVSSLISTIVDASNTDAQNPTTETALITALDSFRKNSSLNNFQITTYTYDPLIGVTSITPPSGIREVYLYDSANRLEKIVDINGNILKEFKYNYKQ